MLRRLRCAHASAWRRCPAAHMDVEWVKLRDASTRVFNGCMLNPPQGLWCLALHLSSLRRTKKVGKQNKTFLLRQKSSTLRRECWYLLGKPISPRMPALFFQKRGAVAPSPEHHRGLPTEYKSYNQPLCQMRRNEKALRFWCLWGWSDWLQFFQKVARAGDK